MINSLVKFCELASALIFLLLLTRNAPQSVTASRPPPLTRTTRLYNFDDFLENIDRANQFLKMKMVGIISRTSDDEDLLSDAGSGNGAPVSSKRNLYLYNNADRPNVCCYLGRVAGERGFHCHSDVYKARYDKRNQNRIQWLRKHFTDSSNGGNSQLKFIRRKFDVRGNRHLSRSSKVSPLYRIYKDHKNDDDDDDGSSTNYNGNDLERKKVWEEKNAIKSLMFNFQSCVFRRPQDFHRCCYTASYRKQQMYRFHRHKHFSHGYNSVNGHVINYFY
ncbi:uncharacterized protein LOC106874468 [Octopus bimaculoides]|uniref:Uncharacterized protein n=1 Tax=Octopus bimaculoides TaxID=37653 RepID=A0A0L8GVX0_OCTBM|nr:uncharacterized protein LOC106874468 [Octopus bimaculoides]|eukprot:XP_014777691.1 PREDICTED: uncharacterized protein LOC106874468 [Octopus bimaculoides]